MTTGDRRSARAIPKGRVDVRIGDAQRKPTDLRQQRRRWYHVGVGRFGMISGIDQLLRDGPRPASNFVTALLDTAAVTGRRRCDQRVLVE